MFQTKYFGEKEGGRGMEKEKWCAEEQGQESLLDFRPYDSLFYTYTRVRSGMSARHRHTPTAVRRLAFFRARAGAGLRGGEGGGSRRPAQGTAE